MGRRKRPHSPGTIFHLTSRTHRHERWFVPELRGPICELIRCMIGRTDADLVAYAVMSNHLHIILRQGETELADIMQPLMRRVAHRVQRFHGFEGAVVERRYRDRACSDADHVRDGIAYIHLNPWKAGFRGNGLELPWTTHAAYLSGGDAGSLGVDPAVQRQVLELFASRPTWSRDDLFQDYLAYLKWRMNRHRLRNDPARDDSVAQAPRRPSTRFGDLAWARYFARSNESGDDEPLPLPDLRDFVRSQLTLLEADVAPDQLRGSRVSHSIARLRRRVIRAATERGYRTGKIARFFDISPQTVSRAKYTADEDL